MDLAAQTADTIARQQAECQGEIDAAWEAMRAFIRGDADGDIRSYIERILVAEMRMAMIPYDVEDDYRFLYGSGTPPVLGCLSAH